MMKMHHFRNIKLIGTKIIRGSFNYECGFWKENNICAYGESLMYERPCWNDGKEDDDEE